MASSSSILQKIKRRRLLNTTREQYEDYLNFIEKDEIFRKGVLSPEMSNDYIVKKWEELTIILNNKSRGPQLSAQTWKKRLGDWKNTVRHKYRKYLSRSKNSASTSILNPLNDLEERAIKIWGRSTFERCSKVPEIFTREPPLNNGAKQVEEAENVFLPPPEDEDLEKQIKQENLEIEENDVKHVLHDEENETENNIELEDEEEDVEINEIQNRAVPLPKMMPQRKLRHHPRKLNVLGEELLMEMRKNYFSQNKLANAINLLVDNQRELMRFKIAAFKYLHPGFEFELQN